MKATASQIMAVLLKRPGISGLTQAEDPLHGTLGGLVEGGGYHRPLQTHTSLSASWGSRYNTSFTCPHVLTINCEGCVCVCVCLRVCVCVCSDMFSHFLEGKKLKMVSCLWR